MQKYTEYIICKYMYKIFTKYYIILYKINNKNAQYNMHKYIMLNTHYNIQ